MSCTHFRNVVVARIQCSGDCTLRVCNRRKKPARNFSVYSRMLIFAGRGIGDDAIVQSGEIHDVSHFEARSFKKRRRMS